MIEPDEKEQESVAAVKQMKREDQLIYIILPIFAIIAAEMLIFLRIFEVAICVHVIILISLVLFTIRSHEIDIYRIYQALMLLPLLRLINISMPIFFEMTLFSYIFIYTPLIFPVCFVILHQRFTAAQIGLTSKNMIIYIFIAIILGLMIAEGEYYIIQFGYLIPDLSLWNLLKLSIVMILFVGVVEELIFRSILQTRLEEFFGKFSGLVLTSLVYGFMHSGYGTIDEMLFICLVGFTIGYLFQETRSLPLISLTHGIANIFLFGLIPHLGSSLNLLG